MLTGEYHTFTYDDWLEYIFTCRMHYGIYYDPWNKTVQVPKKFQKDETLLALKLLS
jgi:hypothetical protein